MTYRIQHRQKKALRFDGANDILAYAPSGVGVANLDMKPDDSFSVCVWTKQIGTGVTAISFLDGALAQAVLHLVFSITLHGTAVPGWTLLEFCCTRKAVPRLSVFQRKPVPALEQH